MQPMPARNPLPSAVPHSILTVSPLSALLQVQRQCCMALRNMSVRNPENRPAILEKGAEGLLRQAKTKHPKTCGDVGAAALRDLGLDNYNEDGQMLHPERMVY